MQHETHRVPVTALAFCGQDAILAGEGPYLKAYSIHDKTLLASLRVFQDQAVHGILVDLAGGHGNVVIWGGNLLRVARLGSLFADTVDWSQWQLSEIEKAADWILDAALGQKCHNSLPDVCIVTAHNALALVNLEPASMKLNLRTVAPGSNCILYCAHIRWLSSFKCLIASGTAFGDIIVWSCDLFEQDGHVSAASQVHYTFSAHQGSVFGVHIASSEVCKALGNRQHVLASCSDDRTICLWDISDLTVTSATLAEEHRDTGFGSKPSSSSHRPLSLGRTMGHVSRIWHVRLLATDPDGSTESVRLLSFGEDAACLIWSLQHEKSSSVPKQYQLRSLKTLRAHSGKHIWSVAIDPALRIATGGADGAVVLSSTLSDCDIARTRKPDAAVGGFLGPFRSFTFLSASEVLTINENGSVAVSSLQSDQAYSFEVPVGDARLGGYSLATSVPGVAFIAGAEGLVYTYNRAHSKFCIAAKTSGKIAGIFAQENVHAATGPRAFILLVTNVNTQTAKLLQLEEESTFNDANDTPRLQDQEFALPPGFVVTSFLQARFDEHTIIMLGSRNGLVAVYSLPAHKGRFPIAASTCQMLHDKESVTSLQVLEKKQHSGRGCLEVLSTGRDGTYAVRSVQITSRSIRLQTIHQLLLPFGPNIEGASYLTSGQLLAWGFRSKHFVVYDILDQREMMTVECGGVHRNWKLLPSEVGGTFLWTQASSLHYQNQRKPQFETLNSGGHGREIKCMAVSPVNARLVATGAEDTNIKLSAYNRQWQCLQTLQRHVTGIQQLQFSRNGRHLFSSGGFEEFFVWRLRSNIAVIKLGVVCESAHPMNGTSDLRIMGFDVGYGNSESVRVDDESEEFCITMVYSDSTIKKWQYVEQHWSLLASGDYLTSCFTQCLHLENEGRQLLTASTDGYVATWVLSNAEDSIAWTSRHRIHQNAILSLVSHRLKDGSVLIITGGDDNAIGLSRAESKAADWQTLLIPRAHAAAVTGLAVVRSDDDGTVWLGSASIDQRVKLWRIRLDIEQPGISGFDIELIEDVFTAVADVSGLEVVKSLGSDVGVLVCGVGLNLWRIDRQVLQSATVN